MGLLEHPKVWKLRPHGLLPQFLDQREPLARLPHMMQDHLVKRHLWPMLLAHEVLRCFLVKGAITPIGRVNRRKCDRLALDGKAAISTEVGVRLVKLGKPTFQRERHAFKGTIAIDFTTELSRVHAL